MKNFFGGNGRPSDHWQEFAVVAKWASECAALRE
jgi:hypothetical protein